MEAPAQSAQPLHLPQRHLVAQGRLLPSQNPWQSALVGASVVGGLGGDDDSGSVGCDVVGAEVGVTHSGQSLHFPQPQRVVHAELDE